MKRQAAVVQEAFEDTFRQHYPNLVRRLACLLGDRAAAEELAQETFLKLYSSPPPAPANLGGWLHRVAGRLALNRLRSEERRRRREAAEAMLVPPGVLPLEEQVLRREEVTLARRVLDRLQPRDRLALLLRENGASYEEVAAVLQVRQQIVGSLLARARRRFLEAYRQERGHEE